MSSLESLLIQSLSAHSILVIGLSFVGGIVSSVLPCTIAMLPVLVGYVGGHTCQSKWEVFLQVFSFILGLSVVMTALGVIASLLGVTFGTLIGSGWYYLVGLIAIVMGLQLLNMIHLPLPQFISKLPEHQAGKILAPFSLGVAFGIASSPCGTPFLAAILGFISQEKNLLLGGASLFFYALGQGALLLMVGMFTGFLKHMAVLRKVGGVVNKMSAFLFFIVGAMLIAQGAGVLSQILLLFHLL